MSAPMEIRVPGAAYYECLDPNASSMAAELGLGRPEIVKRGRGATFVYSDVAPSVARETARHLISMGQLWLSGGDADDPGRGNYRTCIRTGERILAELDNSTERTGA